MARRYIGYGMTNEHGVATLDYDANGDAISGSGYTGVGAGKIDFQAELHDDGSVVSEPYPVLDALFYEDGTTGTPNPNWVKYGGAFDVEADSTGITLKNTLTWQTRYMAETDASISTLDYEPPFCVEFDFISTNNNAGWYLGVDFANDRLIRGDILNSSGNACSVKIRATTTNTYYSINGGTETALNYVVSSPTDVGIRMNGKGSLDSLDVKFKNFRIYPI